ncbi:hypothetical protein AX16_001414 [Volvariella volvacea WC 439]|nr:hypothetical protein AX16_001414 [Volvariella volvacea WC 439]
MRSLAAKAFRCLSPRYPLYSLPRANVAAFSNSASWRSKSASEKKSYEPRDKWNYNSNNFIEKPSAEQLELATVTANQLERETVPPKGVKMLARDFIEDALYNPHYGYFPKQVNIFDTQDSPFDFPSMRDSVEFQEEVAKRYMGAIQGMPSISLFLAMTTNYGRQPWYGYAIAQCLVSEYLLKYFPYEDFIIYEIGAGNGTLAMNILDCLRDYYPNVYERTRYHVIEISGNLAKLQKQRLGAVHPCIHVTHQSIFRWKVREPAPCFFVAMEVVDNFAHDVVRYDMQTLQPYQGMVTIDNDGEFDMIYTPITDPLIKAFLDLRQRLGHPLPMNRLLEGSKVLRKLYTSLPFAPNLSQEEYIPTRLLSLVRTLRNHFPRHRLLLSDFSSLPDTIPGINAPVVQTRFRNVTVPCSKLLVRQGYFDIFFPTNFEQLRDVYEYTLAQPPELPPLTNEMSFGLRYTPLVNQSTPTVDFFSSNNPNRRMPREGVTSASGLPVGERKSSVFSHSEFMETYADLPSTRLINGENPMLDFYKNVKFLF